MFALTIVKRTIFVELFFFYSYQKFMPARRHLCKCYTFPQDSIGDFAVCLIFMQTQTHLCANHRKDRAQYQQTHTANFNRIVKSVGRLHLH